MCAYTTEPFARRRPMMRYRGQELRRFSHNNLFFARHNTLQVIQPSYL